MLHAMDLKAVYIISILTFYFLAPSNSFFAQTVSYDSLPAFYQLYPRDRTDNDSAIVVISGIVVDGAQTYDSLTIDIDRDGAQWGHLVQSLSYFNDTASFSLHPKIYADTVEFSFDILFWDGPIATQGTLIDSVVCGDVYLIQGQSNAVAWDPDFVTYKIDWVRTFGTMTDKNGVGDEDNSNATVEDSIWGIAHAVGPDYPNGSYNLNIGITGLRLGELISETYGIPVCIINGAAGGTEIKKHLRNNDDHDDLNTLYGRLLYRATRAAVSDKVSALFWWQGEGDTGGQASATNYYNRFQQIRTHWRENFSGIGKINTAQLHVGSGATSGAGAPGAHFLREYQRILALNDADTEIMSASDIGGFHHVDFTHFTAAGYQTVADRIFGQIRRDFYNYIDTLDLESPNITRAYFTNDQKNVLILEFDNTNTLLWQNDSTINGTSRYMRDYFYLHNADGSVDSFVVDTAQVFGNLLRLELNYSSSADSVTYLPVSYYNGESGTSALYEGPWLRNSKNIPALSFYKYPIDPTIDDDPLPVTLSSFSVDFINGAAKLNWRTESEINNIGFVILRKEEGKENYVVISSYEYNPSLKGQGTTTQPTDYYFIDNDVISGNRYYYLLQDVDINGNKTAHGPIELTTIEPTKPEGFNLYQNYPNPFNPDTIIEYQIPDRGKVILIVFNTLGEEIKTLVNENLSPGIYKTSWDGRDHRDNFVVSGSYFCQLTFLGEKRFTSIIKMIFLK